MCIKKIETVLNHSIPNEREKINLALKISARFNFFISIIDDVGFDIMLCFVQTNTY